MKNWVVTVKMEPRDIERLDALVVKFLKKGKQANRSTVIRELIEKESRLKK